MALQDILGMGLRGGLPILGGIFAGPAGAATGVAAGGLLGNALGDISDYMFKGSSPQDKMLQQLMQQMQTPYNFQPVNFAPIAQEQTRQFHQNILPGIAERFTGMGGQRSSAFRQALGGAGADLASRLAELQVGHNLGQQQAGMQAYNMNQNRMSNIANLLQGQQAQQQAGRESMLNRYAQFAGMLPKTILEGQRNSLSGLQGLSNANQGMASNLQSAQNLPMERRGEFSNLYQRLTGQNSDIERGRTLSPLEAYSRWNDDMRNKMLQIAKQVILPGMAQ